MVRRAEDDGTLVILGAGGHGRVVADVARANGFTQIMFCDPGQTPGTPIDGVEVTSRGEEDLILDSAGKLQFLIAVGSTTIRRRLAEMLTDRNVPTITLIHPSAVVSPSAHIGRGVVIMPNSTINAGADIGDWAIINTGAIVEHDARVGVGTHISPAATLTGGVQVGEWCDIGAGATILPLLAVGTGTCIGAGSVVVKNVDPGKVYAGVPAKQLVRR